MNGIMYGYARVSAKDQNEARQLIALKAFGICQKHIFLDRQSGKDFRRPQYQRLMKRLKQGDTIVVKSIDRLGRNYDEIIEQWRILTKERQVDIVVLDMPILDTRQGKDLIGTLIADIVLQLLSYVAQTEREFIHQRQAEGIAAAKARGDRFGRPAKPIPPEASVLISQWKSGCLTAAAASRQLGVSRKTFMKWTLLNHN